MAKDMMGDLVKGSIKDRNSNDVTGSTSAPLKTATRPQGRPTKGKNKIQSRTMSLEDEYFELLEMMKCIPRFDKFTRSDVIRAAIYSLGQRDPIEIEDVIRKNADVLPSVVTQRADEIKRILMGKQ